MGGPAILPEAHTFARSDPAPWPYYPGSGGWPRPWPTGQRGDELLRVDSPGSQSDTRSVAGGFDKTWTFYDGDREAAGIQVT